MFLTEPQSRHFDAARFAGAARHANHFDWELYYRYKDERDLYWMEQLGSNAEFQREARAHFAAFETSIERTRKLLLGVARPRILDIGLSSDKLDAVLIDELRARLTVVDVEPAAEDYLATFDDDSRFVISDVISLSRQPAHAGQYDLVYSVGLIEHFPDKREILRAHIELAAMGGLVLIYVPIDTPLNRRLTSTIPELENFGYRELLTPAELAEAVACDALDIVATDSVGLFSAVWARRVA
ncbi:MAG: methyltransferase domain-containing protein [Proteobacteria bacterium]|nr:methyltransferase domain-containing protein [Pseudomonadota bacterium]